MSDPKASFRRVTASGLAVTICGVLPVFLTGGLSVQIRESIDMTPGQYGTAVAMYFIASALSSILMGGIAQRVGSQTGQRFSCALSGSSLLLIALWARSPITLGAALALGGLGNSISQVSTNLSIAQLVGDGRKGFAFGIKQAGIPAATLMGGLAVPLVGLSLGWEWAFLFGAFLAVSVSFSIPAGHGRRLERSSRHAPKPMEKTPLVLLAGAAAFGSAAGNAVGAFFVASTAEAGAEAGTAGLLYAVGGAVCLSSRTLLGWRADRWSGRRLVVVGWMFVAGSVGYLLLATGDLKFVVPALLLTFGAGWGWPGLFNFAIVLQNMEAPAFATGITQTGAYAGGITGSLVFGQIVDRASYSAAWTVAAGWALVAAVLCVVARRFYVQINQRMLRLEH